MASLVIEYSGDAKHLDDAGRCVLRRACACVSRKLRPIPLERQAFNVSDAPPKREHTGFAELLEAAAQRALAFKRAEIEGVAVAALPDRE